MALLRFPPALRVPPSVLRLSRGLTDAAAAVIMAPVCAACGASLEQPTRGAVCAACWDAIDSLAVPAIEAMPPHVTAGTAVGLYDGRLRDVVQALKYGARPTIARHLARRMAAAGAGVLDGADLVVPVPLHRSRERARGFNQARELARHLPRPMLDAIVRTRRTDVQADLPAGGRHANVRGAFALRRRATVRGRVVVLIDDVSTTGATLNACAAVLLEAGASDVRALTAARAPLKAGPTPR